MMPPPMPASMSRCRDSAAPCDAPRRDSATPDSVASFPTVTVFHCGHSALRSTSGQSSPVTVNARRPRTGPGTATPTPVTRPANRRPNDSHAASSARRVRIRLPSWGPRTVASTSPPSWKACTAQCSWRSAAPRTSGPSGWADNTFVGRPLPPVGAPAVSDNQCEADMAAVKSDATPVLMSSMRAAVARENPGLACTRRTISRPRAVSGSIRPPPPISSSCEYISSGPGTFPSRRQHTPKSRADPSAATSRAVPMTTKPARPRSRSALPFAVYLLAAGAFLMGTSEYVIAGLLPEMADGFHVSGSRAGLAITVFAVGIIVGSPATALLTLRLPRRLALVAALVIFAIGHVVAVLSPDFTVMLAARFLTAMVTGAYWAIASVTASRIAGGAASSRAIGVVLGGGMIATAIGVPLGSFAGQHIGWRGPFWLLAVLALVAGAAIGRFVPVDRPGTLPRPSVRAELKVFRSGRVWLVLAACVGITGGVLSVYSFISPLLTDRTGLPPSAVPAALVAFGVAAFAGSILGGRLGGTRPYSSALVAAGVSLACCIGLSFVSTQAIPTLVLFTVLGISGF